jgi:5-formyltetrahydrofolate cyclo-ligase
MSVLQSRQQLRKLLRQQRKSLSTYQQKQAARQLTSTFRQLTAFRKAKKIGFYQATDGEINPNLLMQLTWFYHKQCYLPVLRRFPNHELGFIKVSHRSRLHRHRFGFKEPKTGQRLFIHQLDMVCLPLVGFDKQGQRLGMGGGFYDRSLARLPKKQVYKLGLAHDCQQVAQLINESWDIALDAIITPSQHIKLSV